MPVEVTVIKSNRKTVAIQVNSDLSVTLRVPRQATQGDIQKILKEKESWILKHIEDIKQKKAAFDASAPERLTNDEIHELADKALKYIPERVVEQQEVDFQRIQMPCFQKTMQD